MKKIILLLIVITIGLSAEAFSWQNLFLRPYPTNLAVQPSAYSIIQPYNQTYNNPYYQTPYQTQCQNPYTNSYLYPEYNNVNPYSVINPVTQNLNPTGANSQILKNVSRSLIYSMLRGY